MEGVTTGHPINLVGRRAGLLYPTGCYIFFEDFYKFSHLKRDCSFFDSKTERKNIEKILKM